MKNKTLKSVMAALAVLLSLSVHAVEIDGIYYSLNSTGKTASVISGTNKYTGDVIIPSTITYSGTTYTVTTIGDYAFVFCSGLTSLTIPNSVTTIGFDAFSDCSGLTSITIPNSVNRIEEGAFFGCSSLTSITIPNSVTSIEQETFSGCSSLSSITIGNSVTSIDYCAFQNCSGLTSVTIPENVTSIGESAFWNCSSLTSVTIGSSVTSIGMDAFDGCSGLTSVNISDIASWCGISFSGPRDNPLYYAHHLFLNGVEIKDLAIPNSVTSIGDYMFEGCSGFASLSIPNSVTTIGRNAFKDCSGLISLNIPNSVTNIGLYAFSGCSGLTSIAIPNSVTSIGDYVFCGCSGLTSLTIPNSVTSIGRYAFEDCSGLVSITIGNSVTAIGDYAFSIEGNQTFSLTSVTCYAKNVPTGSNLFGYKIYNAATLYVPNASLYAYRTTSPWSNFKTIASIPAVNYEMTVCVSDLRGTVTYDGTDITDGTETFDVESGDDVVLTLTPRTGYKVKSVTVNDVDMTAAVADGQLAIENVDGDQNVEVEFELDGNTVAVTIGSLGVATFCSLENLDFTTVSAVKAYIVSAYRPSKGSVTMTRIYDVPAGTGLVLKGAAGTYDIPLGVGETVLANMLKGVNVPTTMSTEENGYTNCILANGPSGLNFYAIEDNSTLGAGKAYLPLPTSSISASAKARGVGIVFDDEEEATGIVGTEQAEESDAVYYNLNGQRVERPVKGVYIKNGKKVFVK